MLVNKKQMIRLVRKLGAVLRIVAQRLPTVYMHARKVIIATAVMVATMATIVSGLLALNNVGEFNAWFNREFRTKEYWLQAAESLAPEMNVALFDSKLGVPVFVSAADGLTNRTYVNDYFFTQAIVDESSRVVLYSITLRKPDFNPRVPYLSREDKSAYYLGKLTFKDFLAHPNYLVGAKYIPGFRRSIYSEAYYVGNPGNYLYYFLSSNDAGYNHFGDIETKVFTLEDMGFYDGCNSDILPRPGSSDNEKVNNIFGANPNKFDTVRNSIPNTISITERGGAFFCEHQKFFREQRMFIFGPDLDKVRLLPATSRQ
ncbi:MAG: hypothetical protein JWL85_784 [Candidatus Saccharibacteria bacterium]|nr:hypothetical protein [Candidatus Saccharibacteria bacterium]